MPDKLLDISAGWWATGIAALLAVLGWAKTIFNAGRDSQKLFDKVDDMSKKIEKALDRINTMDRKISHLEGRLEKD